MISGISRAITNVLLEKEKACLLSTYYELHTWARYLHHLSSSYVRLVVLLPFFIRENGSKRYDQGYLLSALL